MKAKSSLDVYSLLYFTTLVVCVIYLLSPCSLWGFYEVISRYLELLSGGLTVILFPLVFSRYKGNSSMLLLISLLFVVFVGINSEKLFYLWSSFVLVTGAKGLPFKTIVKVHFIVSLCFCLLNVYGYETGALKQANNFSDSIREGMMGDLVQRYDYGYGWASDFANHVFFILLDLWILLKGKLGFLWIPSYVFMAFVVIFKADARLSAGLILLLVIISLYLRWKDFRHKQVGKFVKWSIIVSILLFVFLSIGATLAYESSNLYWFGANVLLSNRLQLGSDAIMEFGISWFGQPVEMHGALDAGGLNEYNFVDCSYVQCLLRYGVITVACLVLMYCKMAIQSLRRNDMVLLFASFLVGISGIIAQFVFEYRYCVLLFAFFASHSLQNAHSSASLNNDKRPTDSSQNKRQY